ncbi:MAG: LPS-assembly protein LptD [Anaeromyxobacteraceae bacterium]
MLLAALAALALTAAPATHGESPPLEVVDAGEVEYDVGEDRGRATGGVTLRRGPVTVRASTATYDRRTGEVDAAGGVLLLEPGVALSASAMHLVLDGGYAARDVVAFLKDAPLDLSRCRTMDEARAIGRTRVELGGRAVSGEGGPSFEVDRARITLCDCGGSPPSWEIRARHAGVTPGRGAFLAWPVLYVTPRFLFVHHPVPVLILPALYLPLADRQTGLLLPDVSTSAAAGVTVAEPLFVTLGRSYDLTLTPHYAFGPSARAQQDQGHGVKGFGVDLELRWAPAEGARGQLRVFEQHSVIDRWPDGVARPPGMNRLALSFDHAQRFSDATYLEVDGGLVNDPLYLADFTGDALLRAADYRRSAAAVEHRGDDLLLEADAAYHLPIGFLDAGAAPAAPFGTFGSALGAFHRLPSASASLLPVRLGPVLASATGGVARFAPLRGPTGDEGLDGIGPGERGWTPGSAAIRDAGERDGRWEPRERLAGTRAAVRGELRAPFTVGRALAVEPWVTGTAAAYAFEAGPGPQVDARATGGLALSTSVARSFGAARHLIEPAVTVVAGTGQAGPALPSYAWDELDVAPALAAPAPGTVVPARRTLTALPGPFQQLRLALRNRLVVPAGPLSAAQLDVTVGQDVDLGRPRLAETWAEATVHVWRISAGAEARFFGFGERAPAGVPLPAEASGWDRFTELRANASVSDARGDEVHAGIFGLGPGGSPRLLAGLEPLFDLRPVAIGALAQGSVGARARISGALLSYDALFNARTFVGPDGQKAPLCPDKSAAPHVYQHVASFVWDSPCHCWKAGITASLFECDPSPRFGFVLDLSSLSERRPSW